MYILFTKDVLYWSEAIRWLCKTQYSRLGITRLSINQADRICIYIHWGGQTTIQSYRLICIFYKNISIIYLCMQYFIFVLYIIYILLYSNTSAKTSVEEPLIFSRLQPPPPRAFEILLYKLKTRKVRLRLRHTALKHNRTFCTVYCILATDENSIFGVNMCILHTEHYLQYMYFW